MIGLGTIINTGAIIVAGLIGLLLKNAFSEKMQNSIIKATGLCVIFLGIGGSMQGILSISEKNLVSGKSMMIILSFVLGTLIGELLDIEGKIEKFGGWLKKKTGSEKDSDFIDGFVTASFTVCIGAMAVVGSIQDGIEGDYTILLAKSILDFIIIVILTSTKGKGCIFSAIPVAIFQGVFTVIGYFAKSFLTDAAIANLSLTGSMLIFCVGINLVWKNKFRVANMLPSIIFAAIFAYLKIQ